MGSWTNILGHSYNNLGKRKTRPTIAISRLKPPPAL